MLVLPFRKQWQVFIIGKASPEEVTETYLLDPTENQYYLTHAVQVSLTDTQSPSANEGLEPDLPWNQSTVCYCIQRR